METDPRALEEQKQDKRQMLDAQWHAWERMFKSGRTGWRDMSVEELRIRVWENTAMGDWLDVANYALMLYIKERP